MTDLIEFLRARLADEAKAAERAKWAMQGQWYTEADGALDEFVRMMSPDRVLREVEAKRRMLDRHPTSLDRLSQTTYCLRCQTGESDAWPCPDIADLASVYSDHPEYREEWRPAL